MHKTYPLLSAAVSVPINSTLRDGVDFNSHVVGTVGFNYGALQLQATGADAGCALNITFGFGYRNEYDEAWDTLPAETESVALNGTNFVQRSEYVWFISKFIKLLYITNAETVAGRTALVQAYVAVKQMH